MFPIHDDNPTRCRPYVTLALIGLDLWAWAALAVAGEPIAERAHFAFGLVPAVLTGHAALPPGLQLLFPPLSLVTALFLHAGVLHLVGNLLYLWVFGNNVEDALGHRRFLAFYLGCGVFAGLVQACAAPLVTVPVIGASGAVSGVLGAYLLLHPRASVLVMLPLGIILHPVRLPAAALLVGWFVLQLANSLLSGPGQGDVAWYAHLGGFVCGLAGVLFLKRRDAPLFA
ncbi:MAG: rhomboid family intramembrane serine protease [Gammaproteobacteria bacterium]|nr:rhomboid family intramembrane serine protease [Gammaproteobacteria bacterium]